MDCQILAWLVISSYVLQFPLQLSCCHAVNLTRYLYSTLVGFLFNVWSPLAPWNEVEKYLCFVNYSVACINNVWPPCSVTKELCFPEASFWRLLPMRKSPTIFPEGTHSFQPHACTSPFSTYKGINFINCQTIWKGMTIEWTQASMINHA